MPSNDDNRTASQITSKKPFQLAKNLCAAIGLLFLVVTLTPLTRWWAAAMAGSFSNPPTDGAVLIVLGGSVLNDGTIGGSSYWRAVYGVRLWRLGHYQRVLVCGGSSDGPPVASAIRDYMVSQGVPADIIVTETQSRSTRENALFAAPLLAGIPGKKVLLTSDYHLYRSRRAFARAGILTTPFAFPDVYKMSLDWKGRWPGFLELVTELVKISYYKARGWI
jgi:uncharacterized SAM-binding protein YcdF (DUF218 family)